MTEDSRFCCRAASRVDNFVVGVTNDNPTETEPVYKASYVVCGQYNGSVAAGESAVVVCPQSEYKFRYVVVHGWHSPDRSMCLAEVAIYDRSQ